jgi:hypothetical protein
VNYTNSLFACIIYVYIAVIISVNAFLKPEELLWVFLTHWGWYVWWFLIVLKSALFNCMHMVWHLIYLTCSGWNCIYDVVCMIILWVMNGLIKRWRFRYQGVNELRPTDELRFMYQGVKQLTRPTGKPKV